MTKRIDYETQVLIQEAVCKGKKLLQEKEMPEVLDELKDEYMLTSSELKEIEDEMTRPPQKEISENDVSERFETIYFKNLEEATQAEGILLYKRIPWQQKGVDGNMPFVQFESVKRLKEAQDALGRRWDFVEKNPRRVAVVEFDDLTMYQRVVEYMNKNGMVVDFGTGAHDLQEDVHNAVPAKGKKTESPRYTFFARGRSETPVMEDMSTNKSLRTCHVRRRFR